MVEPREYEVVSIGKVKEQVSKSSGKPYKSADVQVKDHPDEADSGGWVGLYVPNGEEVPKVGDRIKGVISKHDRFGWQLEREQNKQFRKKGSAFASMDVGVTARIAAWEILTRAGKFEADLDKDGQLKENPILEAITADIRKQSDFLATTAQQRKIFALMKEKGVSQSYEDAVRSRIREGRLTKQHASEVIDDLGSQQSNATSVNEQATTDPANTSNPDDMLPKVPF